MSQTFHKTERLKSKMVFSDLISAGHSAKKYPFVLIWKKVDTEQEFPIRIAFSVSKKRFPLAVDRNEMKRKISELYRLNKAKWYNHLSDNYAALLIFTSKEKMNSAELETKLIQVFERFISEVESSN
jgi:ribonuclease P protein component